MTELQTESVSLRNNSNNQNNLNNKQVEIEDEMHRDTYLGNIRFSKYCNQTRIYSESICGLVTSYVLIIVPTTCFYVFW